MWQNVVGPHGKFLDHPIWTNEFFKNNFHNLNLHMRLDMAMCIWWYCSYK
jgi:hypothetical protein